MEEQKNHTLSFLASLGLAAVGAVIFIAGSVLLMSANLLSGTYSLLVMWFVFLALLVGFFIMPIIAYKCTSSAKTLLSVLILEIIFIVALAIIVEPIRMWILFIPFGG